MNNSALFPKPAHAGLSRRLLLAAILICCLPFSLVADPGSVWAHQYNPALLGSSPRGLLDLGLALSPGINNSYFSLEQIFQEEITINLNDLYNSLGPDGLGLGVTLDGDAHLAAHLFGVGLGLYVNTDVLVQLLVPKGLFEFLAEGVSSGTTYEGSGGILVRGFAEAGAYASLRLGSFTFGAKLARFAPLGYSSGGQLTYSFLAAEDGSLTASASASANLYSVVDLEHVDQIDPQDLMTSDTNGLKADLGFTFGSNRREPSWGVSILNIPLAPALVPNGWNFSVTTGASSQANPLDQLLNPSGSELLSFEDPVVAFEALAGDPVAINMPLSLSGFYRFPDVFVVDIVPHLTLIMDDPFRFNAGVWVQGSFFPFNMLSLGLGYEDLAWKTSLGFRLNLHLLDFSIDISSTSPDLSRMLAITGLAVEIRLALGL